MGECGNAYHCKKFIIYFCNYDKKLNNNNNLVDYNKVKDNIENILQNPVKNINKYKTEEKKSDNEDIYIDNEPFWDLVSQVPYYDKDERNMFSYNITFNKTACLYLLSKLNNIFIPILKKKIEAIASFEVLGDSQINNFITHIIFKGQYFYKAVLSEPCLCLYLFDNYYPIYDWLNII